MFEKKTEKKTNQWNGTKKGYLGVYLQFSGGEILITILKIIQFLKIKACFMQNFVEL